MKAKIQENDAPKGYIAVKIPSNEREIDICTGCAFVQESRCGMDKPCCAMERKDGRNVIFVKAP